MLDIKTITLKFKLSDDLDREIWEWYEQFQGKTGTRMKCDLYSSIKQQKFVNAMSAVSNMNQTQIKKQLLDLQNEYIESKPEQESPNPVFRARKVDKSLIG